MVITNLDQIRDAALVVEEMSRIYEYSHPSKAEWSADDLRRELPHMDNYLDQEKIIAEIVERVEQTVMAGADVVGALKSVLHDYEYTRIAQ